MKASKLYGALKVAQAALDECVPMPGHSDPGAVYDCKNIVHEAVIEYELQFPKQIDPIAKPPLNETLAEIAARHYKVKGVRAIIYFRGDPSVGIFSATYEMDLPFADESSLSDYGIEECREEIADMYFGLCDGGVKVYFDFENVND